MRLIDLRKEYVLFPVTNCDLSRDEVVEEIENTMCADVAPVRHGRWVVIDAEEPRRYGCSECKRLSWHMENYCGNCGARMDGDGNETD